MEPTTILEWQRLTVTVRTQLFGPVDEARYEREKAMTQHRAEQMEVQFPRPSREKFKPKRGNKMEFDGMKWED